MHTVGYVYNKYFVALNYDGHLLQKVTRVEASFFLESQCNWNTCPKISPFSKIERERERLMLSYMRFDANLDGM